MEDPAPRARGLMDVVTFEDNFRDKCVNETHLCFEAEVQEGDAWTPMQQHRGFLWNQVIRHAELCFLDLFSSWRLDRARRYRLTCYISWSPCPNCARVLVEFLQKNRHLSLRIFAARMYTRIEGYERGLRELRGAGAQVAIMAREEHQHCWDTFVDNQGRQFESWPNMEEHIRAKSQELESILGNQDGRPSL